MDSEFHPSSFFFMFHGKICSSLLYCVILIYECVAISMWQEMHNYNCRNTAAISGVHVCSYVRFWKI